METRLDPIRFIDIYPLSQCYEFRRSFDRSSSLVKLALETYYILNDLDEVNRIITLLDQIYASKEDSNFPTDHEHGSHLTALQGFASIIFVRAMKQGLDCSGAWTSPELKAAYKRVVAHRDANLAHRSMTKVHSSEWNRSKLLIGIDDERSVFLTKIYSKYNTLLRMSEDISQVTEAAKIFFIGRHTSAIRTFMNELATNSQMRQIISNLSNQFGFNPKEWAKGSKLAEELEFARSIKTHHFELTWPKPA